MISLANLITMFLQRLSLIITPAKKHGIYQSIWPTMLL